MDCLIDANGLTITSSDDQANLLGEAFSTVFTKDDGKLPAVPQVNVIARPTTDAHETFNRVLLWQLIMKWKNSSCRTPDNINLRFMKRIAIPLCVPLEMIFTKSFEKSEIPRKWKESIVTPIKKKPPFSDPLNYRPISITSFSSRLFEKCLSFVMLRWCEENDILPAMQFGFRKGMSTEQQMLKAINDWMVHRERKKSIDVIYCDFSKAFDTVSHEKLLHKLKNFRFDSKIIAWIREYLSQRTFRVRVGSTLSRPFNVVSGVPQGSVLGPILFIIYTADLPELVERNQCRAMMFADDLKIYRAIDCADAEKWLQKSIDSVHKWGEIWQMSLAPQKCFAFSIGTANVTRNYYVNGHPLNFENTVRDLGFLLDRKLTFSPHINLICKKALLTTRILFRGLHSTNAETLVNVYVTYIRPLLEYGTSVWNPSKKEDIDKINKVQNFVTRTIHYRCLGYNFENKPYYTDRNKRLNLECLQIRRNVHDMHICYDILFGNSSLSRSMFEFYQVIPSRTRGSKFTINAALRATTNVGQNDFAHRTSRELSKILRVKSLPLPFSDFMQLVRKN